MKKRKFRFQQGAFFMFIIYGGLFLLLFGRIAYIQVVGEVKGYSLEAKAAAKYAKNYYLTSDRGRIFDRNENPIAEDTAAYKVVAVTTNQVTKSDSNPQHVVDVDTTAQMLAKHIDMTEQEIAMILTKGKANEQTWQVEFGSAGRNLTYDTMKAIQAEKQAKKLPGIILENEKKRHYPNGIFASHLIGFAQQEQQEDYSYKTIGKMGLEASYNDLLTGEDGSVAYDSDRYGNLLPNSEKSIQPAKNGADIYLTIDKTLQNFLEESMGRVYEKYNPESMMAIVAHAKTGEILAMSQRATFNPNTREGLSDNWLNENVENIIEPGSTMKTFTLAAAIDSGNWHPNATYQSGQYTVYDRTIRDHNEIGWGRITYLEGVLRSSNTAMAYMLNIMGRDTFIEYIDKFGFGKKTGIEIANEASGTVLTTYPINIVTTAFGQGSTVTPIQLVQGFTAVANDGKMMQPYLVRKIVDSNTGEVIEQHEPTVKAEPISAETAKQVREILATSVTSEVGSAQNFMIEGYDVSGKTGTAQIAREGGGGYQSKHKNNYLYSFLGMAPANDPQLIVYVAVKKPKLSASDSGSMPTSEVFTMVMENGLKYLNVDPAEAAKTTTIPIQNYVGQSAEVVQTALLSEELKPIVIGEGGTIVEQYPREGLKTSKGTIVFLKTEGQVTIPSFEGWSLRNMLVYKTMSGLSIELSGEGFAASQSVSENTIITDDSPIVVELKTPKDAYTTDESIPIEGEGPVEDEQPLNLTE